jgi:hypothetical protein
MRVGSVAVGSSHMAGMSALWHDADYVPEQRFETPLVQKSFDDLPLPGEDHQLPPGVTDPFGKMEAAYDVAAEQMERGIKGANFLHGKPLEDQRTRLNRLERQQTEMVNQASVAQPAPKGASKTAAQASSEKAAAQGVVSTDGVGDALAAVGTFLPMAAGQAVQSVAAGPLPAMASQALQTAGAVASAVELGATGVAEGLREEPPMPPPRRGLKR